MEARRKLAGLGLVAGAVGTVVLLGLIGLAVVYTGSYNVAATEEHTSLTRWAFTTTFHNSVERRAASAMMPEGFAPSVEDGAGEYKAMCQHCHGGPGVEPDVWASGMRPVPPHLTEAAADWELQEVFWIARHGVKTSGMPAFGPTHDERTLWSIAAFVKELPAMTPERYAELGGSHGAGSDDEHSQ